MPMFKKPEEPIRGGLLGLFDRSIRQNQGSGLNPLQRGAAALDALILPELRGGDAIRQQGAARAADMSRNKTVDMLRKQGRNDLADAVMSGTIGVKEAFGVMQGEKAANTAFQRQKDLAAYQAGLTAPKDNRSTLIQNYEYFKSTGLSDKDAMAQVRSGMTINTGDIGGGDYIYGAKAGLSPGWRIHKTTGEASVIPGGPADIDSAASAEAKTARTQDQHEKDLTFFATGDRILTAINEKTLIPSTGTVASMVSAVPGIGQFQKDVQEDFAQLQAQLQMDALQTLRETSQNGSSGLGQLTDAERTAIGKVISNLTNLKSEAAAATSVKSAMLLKAYFEGGLFDPSINGYRVASESELSAMVNGVNPFGNPEGPQITSDFNQFLPKYVAPQEIAPVELTQQQLMEKYK